MISIIEQQSKNTKFFSDRLLGDRFQLQADFVYHPEHDIPVLLKTLVVFVSIYNIRDLFKKIRNRFFQTFIIVSHNGDGRVFKKIKRSTDVMPSECPLNVLAWYSVNVCSSHWRIRPIPIGLENPKWSKNNPKMSILSDYIGLARDASNLLYINHNIYTNLPQRAEPYKLFANKSWTTLRNGKNGSDYREYLRELSSHKFVLSPEGNGPDCHRTWEALYLGVIPIVKEHTMHSYWSELPILIVKKWDQISEQFLNEKYAEMKEQFYNCEKLKMSYWSNEIEKTKADPFRLWREDIKYFFKNGFSLKRKYTRAE